jgi:hypothetical protein
VLFDLILGVVDDIFSRAAPVFDAAFGRVAPIFDGIGDRFLHAPGCRPEVSSGSAEIPLLRVLRLSSLLHQIAAASLTSCQALLSFSIRSW